MKHAVPWSMTFVPNAQGCSALAKDMQLAKAIESEMKNKFELWASTWITPRLEELQELMK